MLSNDDYVKNEASVTQDDIDNGKGCFHTTNNG